MMIVISWTRGVSMSAQDPSPWMLPVLIPMPITVTSQPGPSARWTGASVLWLAAFIAATYQVTGRWMPMSRKVCRW